MSLGFKVGPYIGSLRVDMTLCRVASLNAPIWSALDSMEEMYNNPAELYRRYERDGYLLLRGLVDTAKITLARREVARVAQDLWNLRLVDMCAETDKSVKGRVTRGVAGGYDVQVEIPTGLGWLQGKGHDAKREAEEIARWVDVARSQPCTDVLQGEQVRAALDALCRGAAQVVGCAAVECEPAPDCAWLRVRGTGMQAPEAADYFHLRQFVNAGLKWNESVAREAVCPACHKSRLSSPPDAPERCSKCPKPAFAVACWVPLGPWPVDGGSLAILSGSHRYSGFCKGPGNGSQTPVGFKSQAEQQGWTVCALDPGDVLLLDSQVVTASTENRREGYFRASLDKRLVLRGV